MAVGLVVVGHPGAVWYVTKVFDHYGKSENSPKVQILRIFLNDLLNLPEKMVTMPPPQFLWKSQLCLLIVRYVTYGMALLLNIQISDKFFEIFEVDFLNNPKQFKTLYERERSS